MLGIAAGASLLAACGGDDGGSADAPVASGNCPANGGRVTIGSNHGHTMTVTGAEVTAGTEKTYDIRGTADHTHSVTVTAALFTMLKASTAVMTISMGGDHSHSINVACA